MTTGKRPFRWTRQNRAIRAALESGKWTPDSLFEYFTTDLTGRPSEQAMTRSKYRQLIDDIARRIGIK